MKMKQTDMFNGQWWAILILALILSLLFNTQLLLVEANDDDDDVGGNNAPNVINSLVPQAPGHTFNWLMRLRAHLLELEVLYSQQVDYILEPLSEQSIDSGCQKERLNELFIRLETILSTIQATEAVRTLEAKLTTKLANHCRLFIGNQVIRAVVALHEEPREAVYKMCDYIRLDLEGDHELSYPIVFERIIRGVSIYLRDSIDSLSAHRIKNYMNNGNGVITLENRFRDLIEQPCLLVLESLKFSMKLFQNDEVLKHKTTGLDYFARSWTTNARVCNDILRSKYIVISTILSDVERIFGTKKTSPNDRVVD